MEGREPLSYRLLGPLDVRRHGVPVAVNGAQRRAVLAVLLLHPNEVVRRDLLVDAVWGERAPKTHRESLEGMISKLRTALAPAGDRELIEFTGRGYCLHAPPGAVDVLRFERLVADARREPEPQLAVDLLREADALWHGEALAEFLDRDFAQTTARRLEAERVAARERRCELELQLGRHAEVVPELEALVEADPFQEHLRELLMLALYRSGRQADALESCRSLRAALLEAGLEPWDAIRRLEADILRHDPALDLVPPAHVAEPTAAAARVATRQPRVFLDAELVGPRDGSDGEALEAECVGRVRSAVEGNGGTVSGVYAGRLQAWFAAEAVRDEVAVRATFAAREAIAAIAALAADVQASGLGAPALRASCVGAANRDAGERRSSVLCGRAAAGELLVDGGVGARLRARFSLEPAGDVFRVGPVRPVQLLPAPLVGRDDELRRLHAELDGVAAGRGVIVVVRGEAGIGKTRLLQAARAELAGRVAWLEGACPAFAGAPYAVYGELLRGWLELGAETTAIARRLRLQSRLASIDGSGVLVDALGGLLGAGGGVGLPAADAVVRWLRGLAERGPLVVVLEDVHWLDASSRALAEQLLALTDELPLGLVLTSRADTASEGATLRLAALAGYGHRTRELSLDPLDDDASRALVRAHLHGMLDGASEGLVVERAEGNPLFLEELLRAFVGHEPLERRRTWTLTPLSGDLPPALLDLLVARIEALPAEARTYAQVAALLGRRFPVAIAERVAGPSTGLRTLLRAEVVTEVGRLPEFECAFHHGLLQEAALATLDAAERRVLCTRLARVYEVAYAGELAQRAEALAFFHAQGEQPERALEHLREASVHAGQIGAPDRARLLQQRATALRARLEGRA